MVPFSSLLHKYRPVFVVVAALLCLLLSSCAGIVEADITVYAGDRYQQEITLSFSADVANLAGGPAEIENMLDEMVAEIGTEGVRISWRKLETQQSNVLQYEIRQSLTKMTDTSTDGFIWSETSYNNRKAYRFEYTDIAEVNKYFQSFTLTLHAGKILESNGTQVDERTVRWVNSRQSPYAIVQPKSAIKWIPLAAAGAFLLVTAVVVFILVRSGRMKTWISTGFSASKWRVQAMKLGSAQTRLEKDKAKQLVGLGTKAWELRVAHPDYTELYGQLEALEQQRVALNEEVQATEVHLQQVRQTRTQTETDYATRIGKLQEERKGATTRLNQARTDKAALEKRLSKAQADQGKTQTEIQSLHNRLAQVQASEAPDRETQAASLTNAINALEQSLVQMGGEMPRMQSEIARLEAEQQPLSDDVARLEQQIAQAQAEQREALAPLDQQITSLQGEIRSGNEKLAALAQQMTPLINELGPHVDRARPESEALSDLYARLDQSYRELAELSQQQDLLKVRLGAADTGAVRNAYLVIGGLLIALILIIVLLVVGLT